MPDVSLTDEQLAQITALGIVPAPDVDDGTAAEPTPPTPPAPAAAPVIDRDIVSQAINENVRYGIVVKVDETPAIVGVDDQGADVLKVHADVAWFGADGLTSVLVDELTTIG